MKVHRRKFSPVRLPALIAAALSLGGVGLAHGDLLITLSSFNGGTATLATFFGTISGFGAASNTSPGTEATAALTNALPGGDRLLFASTSATGSQDQHVRTITSSTGHQFANGTVGPVALTPPPTADGADGFRIRLAPAGTPTVVRAYVPTGDGAPTELGFNTSATMDIAFSRFNMGKYDWGVFGGSAGDAIRLVVIPEPGTAPVLGAALFAGLLAQRRRRR